MKLAKVISVRDAEPIPEDWNPDDCLCQVPKAIPKEHRVECISRKLVDGKWKDKIVYRYHAECPIHGVHRCHAD